MAYNNVQSQPIVIPANTSSWGSISFSGANVLSVGLQNNGFTTNCYPTQLFVYNANTVCYQVDNRNTQPVTVLIWAVTDAPATASTPFITGSTSVS